LTSLGFCAELDLRCCAVARPRRRGGADDGLSQLLSETQELVAQLVKENKALKSRNLKLTRELDRLSTGWEQIKKVARLAPRRRR
jgi:hypothetical protein